MLIPPNLTLPELLGAVEEGEDGAVTVTVTTDAEHDEDDEYGGA